MDTKHFSIFLTRAVGNSDTETKEFRCGLNGYRAEVNIELGNLPSKNNADITIYGLSLKDLQNYSSLVFLAPRYFDKRNQVKVLIDNIPVFQGDAYYCNPDFSAYPNISLNCQGVFGFYTSLIIPDKPLTISAKDNIPIETVFANLAKEMGYIFVNNGVTGICPDIVLDGSLYDRVLNLVNALNLNSSFFNGYLRIAPDKKPLWNDPVKINKANGMIGYPSFTSSGITFRTQYNPLIRPGTFVEINSILPKANGIWITNSVSTTLSTISNGLWESEVEAYIQYE